MALRTLLVGLGGTGCKIVDTVAGMIKENPDPDNNVRWVGLDTDVSVDKVKKLNHIKVISTSKEQIIRNYLSNFYGWQEWFPDNALLHARDMIKGAGQTRPISRLAFMDTVSGRRLGGLISAISELNLARGEVDPSNMRVMIVASFAGGTGSGMYLHIAMWLRKYFKENYNGRILIRGLFALPDMYMNSTTNLFEQESKYANAYGALRELNAINLVTIGNSSKAKKVNMSFDGLFDSATALGDATSRPFDEMFFIDDLNSVNRKLPDLESYEDLMARVTYMQVYSPLTPQQESAEDNHFGMIVAADGKAIFGSSGTASLEYPYHDIVKYCGLRAVIDSIGTSWTFFDNEWYKAENENKEQRKSNPNIPKLDRGDFYIDLVSEHMDNATGIFRYIKFQTEKKFDNATIKNDENCFENIINLINEKSKNDIELDNYGIACYINTQKLNNKSEILNEIIRLQEAFDNYYKNIDERVNLKKNSIVQEIISDSFKSIFIHGTGENSIAKMLQTQEGDYVHPLSARLLLYRIYKQLFKEFEESTNKVAKFLASRNNFTKRDWDETTDTIESATQIASKLSNSKIPSFANGKLKEFNANYEDLAQQQINYLKEYRIHKLQQAVLSEVLSRIEKLIDKYQLFFDNLPKVKDNLINDAKILANAHLNETNLQVYICADPDKKEKIYRRLNVRATNDDHVEVNAAIFEAMYTEVCNEIKDEKENRYIDETTSEEKSRSQTKRTENIFREHVLTKITDEVENINKQILNITVYEALQEECNDKNVTEADILSIVDRKGAPYLLYENQQPIGNNPNGNQNFTTSMIFWGLHEDTANQINATNPNIATYFQVGNNPYTPYVETNNRFSRYKIEYYHGAYGIRLEDIKKLSEKGELGKFYEHYNKRIQSMLNNDETAFTPHLDIRWHKREYLPYINDEKDYEEDMTAAKALWLALAYDKITLGSSEGRSIFKSNLFNKLETFEYDKKYIGYRDLLKLYLLFKNDSKAVEKARELWTLFENEQRESNIDTIKDTRFYKGIVCSEKPMVNAITLLCELNRDTFMVRNTNRNEKDEFDILVSALQEMITDFCNYTSNDLAVVRTTVSKFMKCIYDASVVPTMPNDSDEYIKFADWK